MARRHRSRGFLKSFGVLLPAIFFVLQFEANAEASKEPSSSRETSTTSTIRLHGAVNRVFLLFEPGNRSRWDMDWEIHILSPEGQESPQEGTRFERIAEPGTVWTLDRLDPDRAIIEMSYERRGRYTVWLRIQCEAVSAETTLATVVYRARGHTEPMKEMLSAQLEHQVDNLLHGDGGWEQRINHYLAGGTKLEPFEPFAIEKHHTFYFDASPEAVFAALNPAGGNHWTPTTPKYVFGSEAQPNGAMWRRGENWSLVADYDRDTRSMKSVLLMPEIEFLLEEIRCAPDEKGGTAVRLTWRVVGLSPDGNDAVRNFFQKYWDGRMQTIEQTYVHLLGEEAR